MSLKMAQFDNQDMLSYSSSIGLATMAVSSTVSDIFSDNNGVTVKPGGTSLKVIENGAVRQILYDSLLHIENCKNYKKVITHQYIA